MALFNYATREINAKIVYYGIGLCGKTTNIQQVYQKLSSQGKGKLVTIPTYGDRTIFLDFFPVDVGDINGFKLRFHLYTVPGQVYYNSTRKLVLKGADGVVFVADSQKEALDSNIQSVKNLRENLQDEGIDLDNFPYVIQYNKRDLPDVLSLEELNEQLNEKNVPTFEAAAVSGKGVVETLKAIGKVVVKDLKRSLSNREGVPPVQEPSSSRVMSGSPVRGATPPVSKEKSNRSALADKEKTTTATQSAVSVSIDQPDESDFSDLDAEIGSSVPVKPGGKKTRQIALNLGLEVDLEEENGEWKAKDVRIKQWSQGKSSKEGSLGPSSGKSKIQK